MNHKFQIYLTAILTFLTSFALFSCSDKDEFSASSSERLTFESDTISFDTLFTTIGSSTKRFKVFNNNSKGIRISSVELASAGESGFRVNVDGHSGSRINDIEILKKDSIFIFAEITPKVQNSNIPVYIKDELLFNLESGQTQKIILEAYGQDAIFLHAPIIESDTAWTNEKPYIIYDSLIVRNDATLTIHSGTTICFHSGAYVGVYGQLICNGTTDEPIIFRGDRTDRILSYLPYDRTDGMWGGITLHSESKNNLFDNVDIHSGSYGIYCPVSTSEDFKFYIQNSTIHNVGGDGLKCYYCQGQVLNSQISNSGGNCVSLIGGAYNFVHTTLAQFYPWDGDHGSALYLSNMENDTIYPIEQANFFNCLVTGRSTDEIIGNRIDNNDARFNVLFDHCLVNMKLNGSEGEDIKKMFETSVNETGDIKSWKKNEDGSYSDDIIWGKKNFKQIDDDNFIYSFELSEKSKARGIGKGEYIKYCSTDRNGVPRPTENPDAGCYQFTTTPKDSI